MKKVFVSVVAMLLLIGGVVGAASVNGDFEGSPIIKVKSNGQVLPFEDTPAVLYNNRTMVPIYMLRNLGVKVEWIADEYAVDVTLPQTKKTDQINPINLLSGYSRLINNNLNSKNISASSTFNVDDKGMYISVIYPIPNNISDQKYIDDLLYMASLSTLVDENVFSVDGTIIETRSGFTETAKIYTSHMASRQYINGEITSSEFIETWETVQTGATVSPTTTTQSSFVIESKLDGDFEGFEEGRLFKLTNGDIWEQTDYTYSYSYSYRPDVLIYKDGSSYKMIVDGDMDHKVKVRLVE